MGADGTLLSMFLFGVSYAVASLSCTLPAFLVVTSTTFRNESYLSGVTVFVPYGLGMGIIVRVLTLAVALAKEGVVNKFRSLLPKMNIFAGVFLVIAGAYVADYGYYEVRLFFFDGPVEDPIIDVGERIQSWLVNKMPDPSNYGWFLLFAAIVIGGAVAWQMTRRRPGSSANPPPGEPTPAV